MRVLLALTLLAAASCQSADSAPIYDADGILLAGVACPEFSAKNSEGQVVTQESLLGKRTVLWFYPKAATPG